LAPHSPPTSPDEREGKEEKKRKGEGGETKPIGSYSIDHSLVGQGIVREKGKGGGGKGGKGVGGRTLGHSTLFSGNTCWSDARPSTGGTRERKEKEKGRKGEKKRRRKREGKRLENQASIPSNKETL